MKKMWKKTVFGLAAVFCFISCQNQPAVDTTPPAGVTELKAAAEAGKIVLTWTDPSDSDLYGIKVYNGAVSADSRVAKLDDGILVGKGLQKYEVSGLIDGKSYTFKLSAVDEAFNESETVESEAVVFTKKVKEVIVETKVDKEVDKIIEKPIEKIVDKTVDKEVPRTFAAAVTYTLNDLGATGLEITMNTATEGAEIHYTLDGSEPAATSRLYSAPIVIKENSVIKAVAIKEGIENSSVSAAEVSILSRAILNAVTMTSEDLGPEGIRVSMATSTPGATIYYTSNGLDPDGNSLVYAEPLIIKDDRTIKSVAVKPGMDNGPVSAVFVSVANKTINNVIYTAKLKAGKYTIYHKKQELDGNYVTFKTEQNITVTENTSISDLKQSVPGFQANVMTQDYTITISYKRIPIVHTFKAGTEGKFADGSSETKINGIYEAVCSVPVPTSSTHEFLGWVETSENPSVFGLTDKTFTAKWREIVTAANCRVGDFVLKDGASTGVKYLRSSDYESSLKNDVIAIIIRQTTETTPALGLGIKIGTSLSFGTNNNYTTPLPEQLKTLTDGSTAPTILNITETTKKDWPAFKYCMDYGADNSLFGIVSSGWYLPTITELKLIYDNKSAIQSDFEKLGEEPITYDKRSFVSCNTTDPNRNYNSYKLLSGENCTEITRTLPTSGSYTCAIHTFN